MNKAQKLYPFKFEPNTQILDETSVISNGFLSENSIDDIIDTYLEDFLGTSVFQYYNGEFPVKVSINTPDRPLQLQAHPDNNTALERYDTWGKAKMWYITKAGVDAKIFLGFNKEMDASNFYNNTLDGSIEKDLYSFTPKEGDCIYIKPGSVHAASGELEFIEISQNSEVTYHLTNEMEIAEAIDVIDYGKIDPSGYIFNNIKGNITVVNSSSFIVKSIELQGNGTHSAQSYAPNSFKVYICLNGIAKISADGKEYLVEAGEMSVIPCGVEEYILEAANSASTHLLEVSMPELSEEDFYLNYDEDESDYPVGSGTDPEEDECDCEEEHEHHHHCGCDAHHHEHIGQRFFKK